MNNRSRGYSSSSSSSSRGRGRQSWQKITTDSSPVSQTPCSLAIVQVQADGSSIGRMSAGSLDRKPNNLWQMKGHSSEGAMSRNRGNATPAGFHGQQLGSPLIGNETSLHNLDGVVSRNDAKVTSSGNRNQYKDSSSSGGERSFRGGKVRQWRASSKASSTADTSQDKQLESSTVEDKVPIMQKTDCLPDFSHLSLESVVETSHSRSGDEVIESNENASEHKDNEHSERPTLDEVFDICPPKSSSVITLKPTLFAKNREKRNEMKNSINDGPKGTILRPGMVLLKSYLSSSEQMDILRICRTHGLGPAGFYQPQFREGGKVHMKMMCFGQFWDPETSKYGEFRPMDHAKPPSVPREFLQLVDKAMKVCHSVIAQHSKVKNPEDALPPVKPDICLVNYYAATGRLGLHQDKDESRESLDKGIPIVSFSIGDSAEFLYGDQADPEQAKKVNLESGDVLIFGGKSRHIFHGVSAILPNTAPTSLLERTNFRPGRLNLTFRQHL